MKLKQINREIEAVIDRLKELETKEYLNLHGSYNQIITRRLVTGIFKDLLKMKESIENNKINQDTVMCLS
jgi:predicted transcriptional regulator